MIAAIIKLICYSKGCLINEADKTYSVGLFITGEELQNKVMMNQ